LSAGLFLPFALGASFVWSLLRFVRRYRIALDAYAHAHPVEGGGPPRRDGSHRAGTAFVIRQEAKGPHGISLMWAFARLSVVMSVGVMLGLLVVVFVPPMKDVVEAVACEKNEKLGVVHRPGPRGAGSESLVCYDKQGRQNGANLWAMVIGLDLGWWSVLVLFSMGELPARLARLRR
jgi:hypothetical protein